MSELDALRLIGGAFGVIVMAKIIEVVLMTWFNEGSARLATFSFLIGTVFGLKTLPVETIIGSLVGYGVVWWMFFRRKMAHG